MKERKFESLVQEYPFIIDKHFVLSHSQAVSMLDAAGGALTMSQTIDRAKRFAALSPETWGPFDRLAERIDRKRTRSNNVLPVFSNLKAHKCVALVCAVILAFGLFFGCVPAGRALAHEFIRIVMEIFDGGFETMPGNKGQNPGAYNESTKKEYADYTSFEDDTGKKAFQFNSNSLELDGLYSAGDNGGLVLFSSLSTADGTWIEVQQYWDFKSNIVGETLGYGEPSVTRLADGSLFTCYINETDNTGFAVGVWDNSQVCVYTQAGIELASLLAAVEP